MFRILFCEFFSIYVKFRGLTKQQRINRQRLQERWAAAAAPQNGPGGQGAQQIAAIAATVIIPEVVQPQGHAHGNQ